MLTHQQNKNSAEAVKIQPQLEIGKPDDEHEKEANHVADKVMRTSAGAGDEGGTMHTGQKIQPMTNPNAGKTKTMHTGMPAIQKMSVQNNSGMNAPPAVEKGISSSKGSGESLQSETQDEMSSKIGADMSSVKVHTDSNAVQMSKEIGAKAFTHGNDIYFNQGQYNPSSNEGKHLLAHELTHTIQQGGAVRPKIQRQPLKDAKDKIEAGNVQGGLADPAMRNVFSTVAEKKMDLYGMEEALNAVISRDLGFPTLYRPVVSLAPAFSQYSILQRSSIAFVLGMIKLRQDYIENNNAFLTNPFAVGDPNNTNYTSSALNSKAIFDEIRKQDPAATTVPSWAFTLVSENPDMAVMLKALLLASLEAALTGTTQPPLPGASEEEPNLLTSAIYVSPGFQTYLALLLDDQPRVKKMIEAYAEIIFQEMGVPEGTKLGDSVLLATGDTGQSTGLFQSNQLSSVGVGYFMFSRKAGQDLNKALVGSNLTISFPPETISPDSLFSDSKLEILLNAYGFDSDDTLQIDFTVGEINFSVPISKNKTGKKQNFPGIEVTSTGTGAYISIGEEYVNTSVKIAVSRTGKPVPGAKEMINLDEIQLMLTTNGVMGDIVQPSILEANELFDSGSFISKDISTLQSSARQTDQDLAKRITEFSEGLDVSEILKQLTDTKEGSSDFSRFLDLKGQGINTAAPIPQKFRDDNPGIKEDAVLLDKIQQLKKEKLTEYYQSDPKYSALDYDGIIAMLETYRSSQAKVSDNKINISSTTDPQGTGINPGENNDFPDYYERYIKGTKFGNAVESQGLLKMEGREISRYNNDVLSALRSLSFLKLILMQKGLKETDFAKMDVKVSVNGTEVVANLGEIPTEASSSKPEQLNKDRKKLSTGDVNDYCIQVMAGTVIKTLEEQKAAYESRGWTCRLETAEKGYTRLVVENFKDINDAMTKLEIIRAAHPGAFIKTK